MPKQTKQISINKNENKKPNKINNNEKEIEKYKIDLIRKLFNVELINGKPKLVSFKQFISLNGDDSNVNYFNKYLIYLDLVSKCYDINELLNKGIIPKSSNIKNYYKKRFLKDFDKRFNSYIESKMIKNTIENLNENNDDFPLLEDEEYSDDIPIEVCPSQVYKPKINSQKNSKDKKQSSKIESNNNCKNKKREIKFNSIEYSGPHEVEEYYVDQYMKENGLYDDDDFINRCIEEEIREKNKHNDIDDYDPDEYDKAMEKAYKDYIEQCNMEKELNDNYDDYDEIPSDVLDELLDD